MKKIYYLIISLSFHLSNNTSQNPNSFTVRTETFEQKEAREKNLKTIVEIASQKAFSMGIQQEDFLQYTIYAWCEKHCGKFKEEEINNYLATNNSPNFNTIIQQSYTLGKKP